MCVVSPFNDILCAFICFQGWGFLPWLAGFFSLVLADKQVCPEPADGEQGLYSVSWPLRGKQLTRSKHLAWKPWSKSYCVEWRAGEEEAAQNFKGKWAEVVVSMSVSELEWSEQESSRSHFMAELNTDEASLISSTEHLCLHGSASWTSLCAGCATYTHFSPFTFPHLLLFKTL